MNDIAIVKEYRMSAQIVISEQDLPNWMKRARQGFDWGILLVIGLSLLMAWSFVENPTLPRTNDNIHYAFQAHDMATALREGQLYPRWSPYALGRLGAPIPHYTPPLAAYSTAMIEVLFTNDTILAMRIVYVLSFVIAGLAVYLFVMQRVNALAGLIAALLYVYSPYLGLTVSHVLGDLPLMMVLALIPLLLWTVDRLLQGHQFAILLVACVAAALFLTSPLYSTLGIGLVAILMIIHISETGAWRELSITLLALGLGLGMAAFYWLPAYMEHGLVRWLPVANYPPQYQLTWSELFAATHQLDSGMLRPLAVFNIGWLLLASSGFALLLLVIHRGTYFQSIYLFFGIALCMIIVVMSPTDTWLLGGVILCLAIGGSTIGHWLYGLGRWLQIIAIVGIFIMTFGAVTPIWLSPSSPLAIEAVTPADQLNYEAHINTVALLPANALYPTTLSADTFTTRSLPFESNIANVSRFANTSAAQLTYLEGGTQYARYSVFTEAPIVATYEQAYFMGWLARLDNQAVPLQGDDETGLTRIELPVISNGTLTISLGTTPIRITAWVITYLMVGIAVVLTWRRLVKMPERFDTSQLMAVGITQLLAVLVIIVFVARNMPVLRDNMANLRETANYRLQDLRLTSYATDGHLEYRGYQLHETTITAGDTITLSLYWQATEVSDNRFETSLSVRHLETNTITFTNAKRPPGFYPTSLWSSGLYVEDVYHISIPQEANSGDYMIEINLWQCTPQCDIPVNFSIPNRQLLGTVLPIPMTIR